MVSLKNTHNAFVFLEETAAVEDRLTQRALYGTIYKELLATATPGREPRQAPRIPVAILEGLELTVMDRTSVFYLRVYAWWVLLQCWATLRFSDHRGLNPDRDFLVEGNKLIAKLTWSKTIGEDKKVRYRTVLITECCFVTQPDWFSAGWALLREKADFRRDYLLPSPTTNYRGCVQKQLQYDTASATQTKLFLGLTVAGEKLFLHRVASYWTPHSARNFLPSAAIALDIPKSDRDLLGGWGAQQSDRHSRVSKSRIAHVQQVVSRSFSNSLDPDTLAETEALEDFASYLSSQGLSIEMTQRYSRFLSHRSLVERRQVHVRPAVEISPEQLEEQELVFSEREEGTKPSTERDSGANFRAWNAERTKRLGEALGTDTKAARERIRSSMEPGFYAAVSTKRKFRILHHLGSCYMLPGLDFQAYVYLGTSMPSRSHYEQICKRCAKAGTTTRDDASSGTETSSSTASER